MVRRRSALSVRDPVAIAALVVAAMLVFTLLAGLLVPIYTDEIAWRMMVSRSPLDGGVDHGLGDQCGPNGTLVAPLFMQPMRHLTAWIATLFPDPRAVRITGVGLALLWVALFWRLARALPEELRAAGRTIGLSLAGLGVLPFLLVWSRPEQGLLIAYTLAMLVALAASERRAPTSAGHAWAAALAIVTLGIIALGYHPKGVVFLPIPLIAVALSSRGRNGRIARIVAIALLIGCGILAHRYWSVRFACPDDPALAALLGRENVASALGSRSLAASAALLLQSAPPWRYANLVAPSPDYMSSWLPAVAVPPVLGTMWQAIVRWIWRIALGFTALLLAGGVVHSLLRRTIDPRLALASAVAATVVAWSATQLNKNSYESALQLPLAAIALVLALAVLPPRLRPIAVACARPLAAVTVVSQILLIGLYGPTLAANAARPGPIDAQPYSFVPWGYPALDREILAAARACAIDPRRGRNLLVDDTTYFPMMRSWRPLHRMAHFGPWHGTIGDPVAYLRAHGSSGVITACAYLPPEARAKAKAEGRFCCLWPKEGAAR